MAQGGMSIVLKNMIYIFITSRESLKTIQYNSISNLKNTHVNHSDVRIISLK